ncbi:T-cell immunoreceptor with Ig and ITIM domains isoform X1 [Mauremys reevesii]|uniref:T-cell immunoreceptor with Ig and ITIM domains isoform X1 n=1 Tax=Mauremys reevesii TaxID=260615 RepID=UPI00193FCE01|nr:T-cell immunoreceptor with Ig and ITIM domains isoform X1 [Mauremys reevesii]
MPFLGLSGSMGYPLLLGQLLWHMAPLLHVSGDTTEKILTAGNVSAVENSNITLWCSLSLTNAIVSQVNWNRCNKVMLAVYLSKDKAIVQPAFTEKVSLAAEYGITIHLLGVNDTGDYCCEFHTFPYGIFEGRMFLELTGTSEETTLWKNLPYIIISLILGVLLLVCFVLWILRRKKQTQKIHVPPHVLQKAPSSSSGEDCSSQNPTTGSSAEASVASASSVGAQEESDDGHDYFNVLRYKSHSSRSTVVQMG